MASAIVCVQSAQSSLFDRLLPSAITVVGFVVAALLVRWQVRKQAELDRQAAAQSDRQRAYEALMAAADWSFSRCNLLKTHLDLITWRDPLERILGTKPARDLFDLDAALEPSQAELFRAMTAVRVHGSDEGKLRAKALLDALIEVAGAATAEAGKLNWMHNIIWRGIQRFLGRPSEGQERRDAAQDAYLDRRQEFEEIAVAETSELRQS